MGRIIEAANLGRDEVAHRARAWVAAIVAVAVVVGACSAANEEPDAVTGVPLGAEPPADLAASPTGAAQVTATKIAQLPALLTGMTAVAPGDALVVSDRRGLLWRLVREEIDGHTVPVLEPEPLLDLSSEVSLLGERGMFSVLALDDGASLLVNYTALDGAITVEQFPYRPDGVIDRSEGRTLIELPHPYAWHHGGDMVLDEDRNLHVAVGDMEFRQIDPPGPQDPDLLLGGVLQVPADVLSDIDAEWEPSSDDMVARGLRNPWRLSVDRATGDLWIGDVGLDTIEAVYRIPADELGREVANFGWPYVEGTRPHQGSPPEGAEFIDPVLEREQREGVCGMVGGFVYRGAWVEGLQGRYVYGDLCSGEVRSFELGDDGRAVDDRVLGDTGESVISFGQDLAGELYALGVTGGLYRLDPPGWEPGDNAQEPADPGPTTTVAPRSRQTCDGIVGAVLPLSELATIPPEELDEVFAEIERELDELVPALPDFLIEDGLVVRNSLALLAERMLGADGDPTAEQVQTLRDALLTGDGDFAEFPEAMARIVTAECG